MPGCRHLQSGRPLMLMMLSDVVVFNVSNRFPFDARCRNLQSSRPLMLMMRSPSLSDTLFFNVSDDKFPVDARISSPAKQSAADAHDALSIALRWRDSQRCRAISN